MQLTEILHGLWNLQVYNAEEWSEYLGYFDGVERFTPDQSKTALSPGEELALRISRPVGSIPAIPDFGLSPKITTAEDLASKIRAEESTLGAVSGAFDLLHLGHLRAFLQASRELAGYHNGKLCALILADLHITRKKGPSRPVLNINERLALLTAVRVIDHVVPLVEPDCLAALQCLKPRFFFKTDGDLAQEIVQQEMALLEKLGGDVRILPSEKTRDLSTTSLVGIVRNQTRCGYSATNESSRNSGIPQTESGSTPGQSIQENRIY